MSQTTLIIVLIIAVFLVLSLITIFRYESIKQTFQGLGFRFDISGKKRTTRNNRRGRMDEAEEDLPGEQPGTSSVRIGGRVSESWVNVGATGQSDLSVQEDVLDSNISVKGVTAADASIGGDVDNTDLDVQTRNN